MDTTGQVTAHARVAVITRTKDRPVMLERASASVAGQTFRDFVWVVVNDGGDAGAVGSVVDGADVPALVRVDNPRSRGMEAASNAGIARCSSEYVIIHDDDDSWEPTFLEETVAFLDRSPAFGGVVCGVTRVDERIDGGSVVVTGRSVWKPMHTEFPSGAVHLADIVRINQFPPICFLFRRSVMEAVGAYDETLPVLGDWEFNLRFMRVSDIAVVPARLANYHHRPAASGAYGNSVIAGADRHGCYDALVRNRMVRADIEAGRPGLGMLVAAGRSSNTLGGMLHPAATLAGPIFRALRPLARLVRAVRGAAR